MYISIADLRKYYLELIMIVLLTDFRQSEYVGVIAITLNLWYNSLRIYKIKQGSIGDWRDRRLTLCIL